MNLRFGRRSTESVLGDVPDEKKKVFHLPEGLKLATKSGEVVRIRVRGEGENSPGSTFVPAVATGNRPSTGEYTANVWIPLSEIKDLNEHVHRESDGRSIRINGVEDVSVDQIKILCGGCDFCDLVDVKQMSLKANMRKKIGEGEIKFSVDLMTKRWCQTNLTESECAEFVKKGRCELTGRLAPKLFE